MSSPATYADRLLTPDELERVTGGLTQGAAQVRVLQRMGIPMRVSPDGEPLVLMSSLRPAHVDIVAVPRMENFKA